MKHSFDAGKETGLNGAGFSGRRAFLGKAMAAIGAVWLARPAGWAESLPGGLGNAGALSGGAGSAGGLATRPIDGEGLTGQRYRIAVVDLMILKRQKLSALPLAKELGADGVEVDMGGLGQRETFDSRLADAAVRAEFLAKAKELGLEICSLGMTGFYAQSFAERPTYERMVQDTLDTAKAMGVKTVFLPFGVKGDLVKNPELRPRIVERLKAIAPRAEAAGVTIGIESALDAAGEVKLLDDVGSDAVKSYFNFSNALKNGRDLHAELRTLGRERICQIHCTDDDGVWLENNPRLDLRAVKATLDAMEWRGWLVVERSRDASRPSDVRWNFTANVKFLKSVFQAAPGEDA